LFVLLLFFCDVDDNNNKSSCLVSFSVFNNAGNGDGLTNVFLLNSIAFVIFELLFLKVHFDLFMLMEVDVVVFVLFVVESSPSSSSSSILRSFLIKKKKIKFLKI
jgi:hypothetical protein